MYVYTSTDKKLFQQQKALQSNRPENIAKNVFWKIWFYKNSELLQRVKMCYKVLYKSLCNLP